MSVDQDDKKNKPKTTLIKHNKKTESSEDKKKKKVVVVRKKTGPKKKVVVSKKNDDKIQKSDSRETEKKTVVKEEKADIKNTEEQQKKPETVKTEKMTDSGHSSKDSGSGTREKSRHSETRQPTRHLRTSKDPSEFRSAASRGGGSGFRSASNNNSSNRSSSGNRSHSGGRNNQNRPNNNRSNFRNKSGGGKPSSSGPSKSSFNKSNNKSKPDVPPTGTEQEKTRKKVFKTKKKYQRKKQDNPEKQIQLKKKTQHIANPVPKEIDIMGVITVSDLARKMNLKASDLIAKLMGMGVMVTINQQIDADTATILAEDYGCKVNIVSLYDETIIETAEDVEADMEIRPPVVTVMGHVDHGKTKLLDAIRSTDVTSKEFGGITQHIGAYMVNTEKGKITFLDTPGHSAFTFMRARGAQITDIVVLVVAANDGVMPQTVEAIDHAKDAEVPIIVAINKMDLPDANIDKVKQQLSEHGLMTEDWGGDTMFVEISALKKQGINTLLDAILLQAEMLELKANYNCNAEGRVIESRIDHGRGVVASVLIQKGILKVADSFVAGVFPGKVRAMFNDKGERIEEVHPAYPVEILGLDGLPQAGEPFQVTDNERTARQIGLKRQELRKLEEAQNLKKITLDNLYDSIQEGGTLELKVIIKGDVHGSVEALQSALEKLSTSEIRLRAIHTSAGAINESDVMMASASTAIIIGFHVRPTPRAAALAEQEKVEVRKYNVIFDAVDDIKNAMEGMLSPELKEEQTGEIEIREIFKVPKIGNIAGCFVKSGFIERKSKVRIYRDDVEIYDGQLTSLKRFKDDVKEVKAGFDCGMSFENFQDIKEGDIVESYKIKEVAKKLGAPLKDE